MRLDKYINDMTGEGRSIIKKKIKAGMAKVNGMVEKSAERQIDADQDVIIYEGNILTYSPFHYYILHKPSGYVSARTDKLHNTVLDLLGADVAAHIKAELFPVGRLDLDTEGLLILTDDGELAHELLSPAKHVEKEYLCHTFSPITETQIEALEKGVDIGEKKLTKPAKICKIDTDKILLTISEGKFHQIKRMLHVVGNEVVYLKRIRMASIILPKDLEVGSYRSMTDDEIECLRKSIENK